MKKLKGSCPEQGIGAFGSKDDQDGPLAAVESYAGFPYVVLFNPLISQSKCQSVNDLNIQLPDQL